MPGCFVESQQKPRTCKDIDYLREYLASFIRLVQRLWEEEVEQNQRPAHQYQSFLRPGVNILCSMLPEIRRGFLMNSQQTKKPGILFFAFFKVLTIFEVTNVAVTVCFLATTLSKRTPHDPSARRQMAKHGARSEDEEYTSREQAYAGRVEVKA
ncbi:hypothetical protein BC567DRAFT_258922 [Phyllosticta citribraziliensis]